VPTDALPEYAIGGLADIDGVFVSFYDAYVKYERDLADWNMKYAPKPVYAPVPASNMTAPPAASSSAPTTSPSNPR